MSSTLRPYVKTDISDGIARIEFFHPAGNSLPGDILGRLAASVAAAGADASVKVILLKSAGKRIFCAGASFDELTSISNEEEGTEFFLGFARVIRAMRSCPKLIIGRVQGKAVGGGVGLAAAADICFATETASIKLSELSIGIGPFVIGPAVQHRIGRAAFSQLAIDATRWQTARWAKEKGLYAEVCPDMASLDEAVQGMATTLARSNPEAMSLLKKTLWEGTADWETLMQQRAAMSGRLVLSEFTADALRKFREKK